MSTPGRTLPSGIIFESARVCLDSFRASQAASISALQPYQQQYWAWANQLKVFAKPHICLDAQIKDGKFDRLRHAILLLLNLLRDNITLALKLSSSSTQNENSASVSKSTAPQNQHPLQVPLAGIEAALKRLDRIAIIILQATQNSLARRIDVYTEESRNKSFEKRVETVLCYRFQDALPPGLRNIIYSSVLHRHYRILYDRDHRDQENPRWVEKSDQEVVKPVERPPTQPAPKNEPVVPIQEEIVPEHVPDMKSEAQTQPLTVDEEIVRERLKEGLSAPPSRRNVDTASRSETGDALYPKAPEIQDGQSTAICTICLKEHESDVYEGQNWRSHVESDLQPYVCISEDCSTNLRFFTDRGSWLSHMQQRHTLFWIKYLHNVRVWKCALPHPEAGEFESEEELLDKHMRIEHSELGEATLKSMAHNGGVPVPRRFDICPICGDEHRPQKRMETMRTDDESDSESEPDTSVKDTPKLTDSKATKPVVRFAEPEGIAGKPSDNAAEALATESKNEQLSSDTLAHRRMERYIGKHLKALAFFFARDLIDQDNDEDEESSVGRGRSLDDLQSVDLLDLEDPPRLLALEISQSNALLDDTMYIYSPEDLERMVSLARIAPTPQPVAWRPRDPSREGYLLTIGYGTATYITTLDRDVSDVLTVDLLREYLLSRIADDLSQTSMVFQGQNLDDKSHYHGSRAGAELQKERLWEEVLCIAEQGPVNTLSTNEFKMDQNVIDMNHQKLDWTLQKEKEHDFDCELFWEDDWMQNIFQDGPVYLQEAAEVWQGIEPLSAYAVAANMLIFLELYSRRKLDDENPNEAGIDQLLSDRLKLVTNWAVFDESLEDVWSLYAKTLRTYTTTLAELSEDLATQRAMWLDGKKNEAAHLEHRIQNTVEKIGRGIQLCVILATQSTKSWVETLAEVQETALYQALTSYEQPVIHAFLVVPSENVMATVKTVVEDLIDATNVEPRESVQPSITTVPLKDIATPSSEIVDFVNRKLLSGTENDRIDRIANAHVQTCEWIFDDSDFSDWLHNCNGIFWISGKPGSGKSTLLKHIANSSRTRNALESWAKQTHLTMASGFLWQVGTQDQRTVIGLLGSLLGQILRQQPNLIPILFPFGSSPLTDWPADFPTFWHLQRGFSSLLTHPSLPISLFLVIDGLDELEGDVSILLRLLHPLSDRVKLLVSSRPWPVFEDSFRGCRRMQMQDWTREDIVQYVHDALQTTGVDMNSSQLRQLQMMIVERAAGNFLWVFLTVRSICEGLLNGDSPKKCLHRLEALPQDLNDMFEQITRSIEPSYRERFYRVNTLMRMTSDESLIAEATLKGCNSTTLTVLDLAYLLDADESSLQELVEKTENKPLTESEMQSRYTQVRRRLQSYTKGLLEIVPATDSGRVQNDNVQYMHNSVKDFIQLQESSFETNMRDSDPAILLLLATVLRLKCYSPEYECSSQHELVSRAIYFAKISQPRPPHLNKALRICLDQVDAAITEHLQRASLANHQESITDFWNYYFDGVPKASPWQDTLSSLIISEGLLECVIDKIERNNVRGIPKNGRPLLEYACIPITSEPIRIQNIHPSIVHYLLSNRRADVNGKFDGVSAWERLIPLWSQLGFGLWLQLVNKFVVIGNANVNAFATVLVLENQTVYRFTICEVLQFLVSGESPIFSKQSFLTLEPKVESEMKDLLEFTLLSGGEPRCEVYELEAFLYVPRGLPLFQRHSQPLEGATSSSSLIVRQPSPETTSERKSGGLQQIEEIPTSRACRQCGHEWYQDERGGICPICGSDFTEVIDREQLLRRRSTLVFSNSDPVDRRLEIEQELEANRKRQSEIERMSTTQGVEGELRRELEGLIRQERRLLRSKRVVVSPSNSPERASQVFPSSMALDDTDDKGSQPKPDPRGRLRDTIGRLSRFFRAKP